MTYNDYLIKITEIVKIRSVNYRLSQNDIIYMTSMVYTEIMQAVNFKPMKQEVLMIGEQKEYDLETLYTPVSNELNLNVYKIEDKDGLPVSKYFRELDDNKFKLKYELIDIFYERYADETISFYRNTIPDIIYLDTTTQLVIFEALVNGIMYYTHGSIPSPTASNVPFNENGMYYK